MIGAANLPEHDLVLVRSEHYEAEVDWDMHQHTILGILEWKKGEPTIYIHDTSAMADETLRCVKQVVEANTKSNLLNYLDQFQKIPISTQLP